MLAAPRPGEARADLVPARRADARRRRVPRRPRPGSPPPRRAGEPGGVLPRRRRLPRVPRAARARARATGPIVDEDGLVARHAPGLLAVHARASAAGSASPAGEPLYALRDERRPRTPSSSARARRSRATTRHRVAAGCTCRSSARRSKVRYRSPAVAADGRADRARVPARSSTSPSTASPAGQTAVLYEGDAVVGRRPRRRSGPPKIPRCSPRSAGVTSPISRWRSSCSLAGAALRLRRVRLGGTLGRASSLLQGTETELLPVISKLGGTVDRVNVQLDKVDLMTDSAVDAVAAVDTAVRDREPAVITTPIGSSPAWRPAQGARGDWRT